MVTSSVRSTCRFNAYARGVVVEVRLWSRYGCGRGTVVVEVRSWSRYGRGRGTVVVQLRCARGAVEVHSWCASCLVQFVNFSTGDTVHVHR